MYELNRVELEAAVKEILLNDLQVGRGLVEELCEETPLLGRGLGLDSMEALTLATSLEQRFHVQIADSELTLELFSRFSNLLELLQKKMTATQEITSSKVSAR